MREIKFRGKRVDSNEWIYGYLFITQKSNPLPDPQYFILNEHGSFIVEPDTVGQFTGFTDKKDKGIYEGDICSSVYGVGEVYWNDVTGKYSFEFDTDTCELFDVTTGREGNCFEVISNIHDNTV